MGFVAIFQIINIVLPLFTFIALILYAYFTYIIAKDINEPFVSFTFNRALPIPTTKLNFHLMNKSKMDVEVFGKFLCRINDEMFESEQGFYNDEHSWILQPFGDGNGYLELRAIHNKKGIKLSELLKDSEKIKSIEFTFQIKYRKVGSKKWKKSPSYRYVYDFRNFSFYPKV